MTFSTAPSRGLALRILGILVVASAAAGCEAPPPDEECQPGKKEFVRCLAWPQPNDGGLGGAGGAGGSGSGDAPGDGGGGVPPCPTMEEVRAGHLLGFGTIGCGVIVEREGGYGNGQCCYLTRNNCCNSGRGSW